MEDWREEYESICNAPLVRVNETQVEDGHPALRFSEYWHSLSAGTTPARGDFHPRSVPALLKWLMMFRREMQNAEDRYKLYLQGEAAAALTDGLLRGRYLDEFTLSVCFESRRQIMRDVIKNGKPIFATIAVGAKKADFIVDISVGMFPFFSDGAEPEIVVVPAPASRELRQFLQSTTAPSLAQIS